MLRLIGPRVFKRAHMPTLRLLSTAVPKRVVVLSTDDNPALAHAPLDAAELLIGGELEDLLKHGEKLQTAEALLWVPPTPPAVLNALIAGGHVPSVRWVHGFYAGVDPIAMIARERLVPLGIPLSNGRGAFSSSLAEYVMTAALHFNKQVPRCLANRRERRWDKFEMAVLKGKTMGLLGFGDIAQHTARLAKAFGMRVVALRRNASKPDSTGLADLVLGPYEGPIQPAHKRALLEQSDVVVSTLPGTEETRYFMSSNEFAMMKPGATFISIGRGIAVDEAALVAALPRLGGAALDVFEVEPLPSESALWDVSDDKLLLTAHNADLTADYFQLGWDVWRSNYDCFLRGDPLATPVDPAMGY